VPEEHKQLEILALSAGGLASALIAAKQTWQNEANIDVFSLSGDNLSRQ